MEPARAALPPQGPRGALRCVLDMSRIAPFKRGKPLFAKDFA
jgi:hypothetical protein